MSLSLIVDRMMINSSVRWRFVTELEAEIWSISLSWAPTQMCPLQVQQKGSKHPFWMSLFWLQKHGFFVTRLPPPQITLQIQITNLWLLTYVKITFRMKILKTQINLEKIDPFKFKQKESKHPLWMSLFWSQKHVNYLDFTVSPEFQIQIFDTIFIFSGFV